MFEQAIAADPAYALAHAGLADCCTMTSMYYPPGVALLELAETASRRALSAGPGAPNPDAHRHFARDPGSGIVHARDAGSTHGARQRSVHGSNS